MPPRQKQYLSEDVAEDNTNFQNSQYLYGNVNNHNNHRHHHDHRPPLATAGTTTQHQHQDEQQEEASAQNKKIKKGTMKITGERHFVLFRIGAFRFGLHGISGIFSLIFVSLGLIWKLCYCCCSSTTSSNHAAAGGGGASSSYRYYNSQHGNNNSYKDDHHTPFFLAIGIVLSTLTASLGSYGLLSQVPTTSHISSWIFPPHREAFKRTISIIVYLNLRLAHQWNWIFSEESIMFPILLGLYTLVAFSPVHSSFSNGNTWVFVIPMFIGFSIDTWKQFPALSLSSSFKDYLHKEEDHCYSFTALQHMQKTPSTIDGGSGCGDINSTTTTPAPTKNGVLSTFFPLLLEGRGQDWSKVHRWNHEKANESFLLLTLWCALEIAFLFTVAFRGKMRIQSCYWFAALQVSLLFTFLLLP